jgi:hypothetical protein
MFTMSLASLENATSVPSELIVAWPLVPLEVAPPPAAPLRSVVVPAARSRRNRSVVPFQSPAAKLSAGRERHPAAVRGDRRLPAVAVPLRAVRIDAHELRYAVAPIADEDVGMAVEVDVEVGRVALERDDRPVPREAVAVDPALQVAPRSVARDADDLRRAGPDVVDEDVGQAVDVGRGEVVGVGEEGRDVAVGGEIGESAAVVGLVAVRVDVDPLDRAGLAVDEERVVEAVLVAGHEVVRLAHEEDALAVVGDAGTGAVAVRLVSLSRR